MWCVLERVEQASEESLEKYFSILFTHDQVVDSCGSTEKEEEKHFLVEFLPFFFAESPSYQRRRSSADVLLSPTIADSQQIV